MICITSEQVDEDLTTECIEVITDENLYKAVNHAYNVIGDIPVIGYINPELTQTNVNAHTMSNVDAKHNTLYLETVERCQSISVNSAWACVEDFRYFAETLKLLKDTSDYTIKNETYLISVVANRIGFDVVYV